jgi:hypothetical protein
MSIPSVLFLMLGEQQYMYYTTNLSTMQELIWTISVRLEARARRGTTGRCRPTNISGFLSGVWEFEATGASGAASRARAHCTWPLKLRHRTGVYGVWGVCPP